MNTRDRIWNAAHIRHLIERVLPLVHLFNIDVVEASAECGAFRDALRSFGQKAEGRLPAAIVRLPPELGPLMSTMQKPAPAGAIPH